MTSLMSRYSLINQNFATSQILEKWLKTPWNFKGDFFSIKLTKKEKKTNQGCNVLYIRGYDFTYAEFKTL